MTSYEKQFHDLIHDIPKTRAGKAFGAHCIKTQNDKTAAIFWQDNVLFKLDRLGQKAAMEVEGAQPGTHLYDTERPMKGWVWIPSEHADVWEEFAKMAVDYVSALKK